MKELNTDDKQNLVRSFLQQLNDEVNGDEWKCVSILSVFHKMPLHSFGEVVVPYLIQELFYRGLVVRCDSTEGVKITRLGKERIARTAEANAFYILETLISQTNSLNGINANRLAVLTQLRPDEINDAVQILAESGDVEFLWSVGPSSCTFDKVTLTPRGRHEYEQRRFTSQSTNSTEQRIALPPSPIGSPYGFTEEDWETVSTRKRDSNIIYVVFALQFQSGYYNSSNLRKNIQSMFLEGLHHYQNQNRSAANVDIDFKSLSADYGGHLFNGIARDIISADIAVFEVSDRNSNVMIELGVALTWGTRVMPIRHRDSPSKLNPSDISGHTWTEYLDDGKVFTDTSHSAKVVSIVERAWRKKRRVQ